MSSLIWTKEILRISANYSSLKSHSWCQTLLTQLKMTTFATSHCSIFLQLDILKSPLVLIHEERRKHFQVQKVHRDHEQRTMRRTPAKRWCRKEKAVKSAKTLLFRLQEFLASCSCHETSKSSDCFGEKKRSHCLHFLHSKETLVAQTRGWVKGSIKDWVLQKLRFLLVDSNAIISRKEKENLNLRVWNKNLGGNIVGFVSSPRETIIASVQEKKNQNQKVIILLKANRSDINTRQSY